MRWSWLRAVMLGLMIGPAPADAEPGSPESAEAEGLSPDKAVGHAVRGARFHVWDEDAREAEDWALELRRSTAETVESARWRVIAARAAAGSSIPTGEEEADPVAWLDASGARAGLSPLGIMLCLLPSLDRTYLISSLATSSHEPTRLALARALAAPFEAVGALEALEHLQRDASADVRRSARSSAALRGPSLSRG